MADVVLPRKGETWQATNKDGAVSEQCDVERIEMVDGFTHVLFSRPGELTLRRWALAYFLRRFKPAP